MNLKDETRVSVTLSMREWRAVSLACVGVIRNETDSKMLTDTAYDITNQIEAPTKSLTPDLLAEAFDAFNNAALSNMHAGGHDIGSISAGFAAVAQRLREG